MASILRYAVMSGGLNFVTGIYTLSSVFLLKFHYAFFTLQLIAGLSLWSLEFDFWTV